jgi:cob(I)alamin adenosyltransferase
MNRGPNEYLGQLPQQIEDWGCEIEKSVPPFDCFILPGGCESAAFAHLARTVARRAERCAVTAFSDDREHGWLLKILNRLSDYLFLLGRFLNTQSGTPEIKYRSQRESKEAVGSETVEDSSIDAA